ncbi:RHS repeat domain-containing protein [Mucilaginibacter auburnensis]|nr:RHS repeat-associated core domain-containing protein [Mucilaginibacter auburnensis]
MITDANGAVQEKRHFDAWGNIVKLENGAGTTLNALGITDRGYTGHEHLQGVGLINMNARLYDPLLHRFLAPDNFVQDPGNTQNFNRYAYVMNNPLKFTDKSGEFWEFIILGLYTNALSNHAAGKSFFDGWLKAVVLSAAQSGVANLIGNAAVSWHLSGLGGAAFQAVAHGTAGGLMSVANGGNFGPGFLSGFTSSIVGSALKGPLSNLKGGWGTAGMYGSGMLSGGLSSKLAGGNFWDGVRNGAIITGLNHMAHAIQKVIINLKGRLELNRLAAQFDVKGIKAGGLQVIQVYRGTGGVNGNMSFVDGGINSPYASSAQNGAPAQEGNPYYLNPREVSEDVSWSGTEGSLGVTDRQNGAFYNEKSVFDVILVATNYNGTGVDRLLGGFTWGYDLYRLQINGGNFVQGASYLFSDSDFRRNISAEALKIINKDYPKYKFSR